MVAGVSAAMIDKTIDLDGQSISYVEAGQAGSPPVVLLTGWAQDNRLFKNVIPHLAEHYHVLSPNWRGHQGGVVEDFGANDLVGDVARFVDLMGISGEFRTVSHSHGCWVNIELCDRFGIPQLGRTVLLDWLMEPHPDFERQVHDGKDPALYEAARNSMFHEWAANTDNADVLNHIYNEMPSFGGEMWMRANREIEAAYSEWGSPLKRMLALKRQPEVLHIFSQPTADAYRRLQDEFSAQHVWFHPLHLPGRTHFPSLENGPEVARQIHAFFERT